MFQYAFGRANAERLGVELALEASDKTLKIHNGFELCNIFNIQAKVATRRDIQDILGWQSLGLVHKLMRAFGIGFSLSHWVEEPHFHFSLKMLEIKDNSYICGYWQSEKYFQRIASIIRSEYSFKQPLSRQNAELVKKIGHISSVSLHVRRNDYANNPRINSTHGLCSLEYYQSAIQYIVERVEYPFFFIFSDDIVWVRNNLRINFPHQHVSHNQGAESYNDMRLMSLCRHHIIANSTFSWWGAWLNPAPEKIVIAPKRWFVNSTNTHDLIPPQWVVI